MKKIKFKVSKKVVISAVSVIILSSIVGLHSMQAREIVTAKNFENVEVEVKKETNLEKKLKLKDGFLVKKTIDDSDVDYEKIGNYKAVIVAEPLTGKILEQEIDVKVVDTQDPAIILDEEKTREIEYGSEVNVKEYFSMTDNYENEETLNRLVVADNVKTDQLGEIESKIISTDTSGNKAESVIKFNVVDTQAPEIHIEEETIIEYGSKFSTISNLTIKDNVDELTASNVTVKLNDEKVSDNHYINTKQAGTYTLKYIVKDKSGNETTKERKVTVKEYVPPVVQPATNVNSGNGNTRNSGGGGSNRSNGGASSAGSSSNSNSASSSGYALTISTGSGYWWSGNTLCAHNPGSGSNFKDLGVGSRVMIDGVGYEITKSYIAFGSKSAGYDVTDEQSLRRTDNNEYVADEYMFRNYSMQTCYGDNKRNYIKILRKIDGGQPAQNSSISVSEPQ